MKNQILTMGAVWDELSKEEIALASRAVDVDVRLLPFITIERICTGLNMNHKILHNYGGRCTPCMLMYRLYHFGKTYSTPTDDGG